MIDDSVEREGDEGFADAIRLEQHDDESPPPPEPEHGVERPVTRKSPNLPSRQEVLEHWITHLPFRNWCQHCVAGKCKSKPHMTAGKIDDENGTPIVAFDYAFMSRALLASLALSRASAVRWAFLEAIQGRATLCRRLLPVLSPT